MRPPLRRPLPALLLAFAVLAVAVPVAISASSPYVAPGKGAPGTKKGQGYVNNMVDANKPAEYPGMQRTTYRYGPVTVTPGQNVIKIGNIPAAQRPSVPGYITAFRPNLTYVDGSVPGVDVVHLHHGVWLIEGQPQWAVGEEKSNIALPEGFGWRYTPDQQWLMNDMVHNLVPSTTKVYITWTIDFVPDSSPAAATMKDVRTQWMDVAGLRAYPVFDALRKWGGKDGTYTFPDDAPASQRPVVGPAQKWTVRKPSTILGTVAHLHPGGLYGDLKVTRNGVTKRLFRSYAKYWEPAGPVSWDVAMTMTPPDWRVELQPGDVVSVHGTYETKRASWYESMAIMPLAVFDGVGVGGVDPFVTNVDKPGVLTHGALNENANHGGGDFGLPDARRLLSGSSPKGPVTIKGFLYSRGDMLNGLKRVPTVRQGQSLTFKNLDDNGSTTDIFHTVTACKAPCNKETGIAYPLADGPVDFDSGELGTGPAGFTAAKNELSWKTPKSLRVGTYTYFCRVHPFMRGAFRVVSKPKSKAKKRTAAARRASTGIRYTPASFGG